MSYFAAALATHPPLPPQPIDNGIDWRGREFPVWSLPVSWLPFRNSSGVYIYAFLIVNEYYCVYVGESGRFGYRILEHQKHNHLIHGSSSHILFLQVDDESVRQAIEEELISYYNPPLNILHRTGPAPTKITSLVPDLWGELRRLSGGRLFLYGKAPSGRIEN